MFIFLLVKTFVPHKRRYKHSHAAKMLKDAYEQLKSDFPASEWTQRASPCGLP
jgi:hypothetical protein